MAMDIKTGGQGNCYNLGSGLVCDKNTNQNNKTTFSICGTNKNIHVLDRAMEKHQNIFRPGTRSAILLIIRGNMKTLIYIIRLTITAWNFLCVNSLTVLFLLV